MLIHVTEKEIANSYLNKKCTLISDESYVLWFSINCFLRSRLETAGDSDDNFPKAEIKIKISDDLKGYLIDECEAVTKQNKFPTLPMRFTVDKILNDYVESKTGTCKGSANDTVRYSRPFAPNELLLVHLFMVNMFLLDESSSTNLSSNYFLT